MDDNSDFSALLTRKPGKQKTKRKYKPKRQTRRAIGLRGLTVQRLKNYARSIGIKHTPLLETWIAEALDREDEKRGR